jgi:putative ABC transport system substrate-binding protein
MKRYPGFAALILSGILLAVLLTACSAAGSKSMTVGIYDPFGVEEPVKGFKDGLAELGYIENENIKYIDASQPAGFDPAALEASARELVDAKVDLIYCVSTSACVVAKKAAAGTDIAIVFVAVADPISTGLVADFAAPGSNVTGIASAAKNSANEGVRLEWLIKATGATRVFIPYGSTDPATLAKLAAVQEAAGKLGVELVLYEIKTPEDATAMLGNLPEDIDALFTFSERIFTVPMLQELANAAIARQLPYSAPGTEYGALMSYAPKLGFMGKQSARLADQIFKGVKPAELPVETPEFFLVVSIKTAEAIGLTLPNEVIEAASEVIR